MTQLFLTFLAILLFTPTIKSYNVRKSLELIFVTIFNAQIDMMNFSKYQEKSKSDHQVEQIIFTKQFYLK
jgi:hypothetical protein